MADVYLERSDLELSKDDIFESNDIEELSDWLNEQQSVSQEIDIMIDALKKAGPSEARGLARKLGYVNVSILWLQNRLSALGVTDDRVVPVKDRKMKDHLDVMAKNLQDRNATIKTQNVELTELRQALLRYKKAETRAALSSKADDGGKG